MQYGIDTTNSKPQTNLHHKYSIGTKLGIVNINCDFFNTMLELIMIGNL